MTTLRGAGIMTVFLAVTLLLLPVQWVAVQLGRPRSVPLLYHRFLCRLLGIKLTVIGTPATGGVLLAANHTGWLDIPILSAISSVSFVAKSEVNAWPFFGTLARLQRTIFIRRGEKAKALEDRDHIRRRLLEGDALVLFPEGTSSDGNRVLPFKSALLSAAELSLGEDAEHHERHALVQPVSVAYTKLHGIPMGRENRPFFAWYGDMELVPHLWESFTLGPMDAVVEFHPPVTIDEAGDRKRLAQMCERAVRAGVIRALTGADITPANSSAGADAEDDEVLEGEMAQN